MNKYGLVFERHQEYVTTQNGKKISFDEPFEMTLKLLDKVSGTAPKNQEHILFECDNYVGLKYLQYTHQEKVDLIYIDPPYNTGNQDWKYNDKFVGEDDSFRHSKWLSFMEKRLLLAKKLLSQSGVIFISIDDHECHTLKMLCNEIFTEKKFVLQIPWRKRASKSDVAYGISQDFEWILVYANSEFNASRNIERKYYTTPDFPNRPWRLNPLTQQHTKTERPNSFFTIINPKNNEKFPANPNRLWSISKDTYPVYASQGRIVYPGDYPTLFNYSAPMLRVFKEQDDTKGEATSSVSSNLEDVGMTANGTKELTSLFGEKPFPFPKPTSLIKKLISWHRNKNITVLDFFAGSGTTFQAVAELNEEDGGTRQCILMTNNESNICREVTWERVKRVTTGTANYPECTKKYPGCPSAHASFYTMEIS